MANAKNINAVIRCIASVDPRTCIMGAYSRPVSVDGLRCGTAHCIAEWIRAIRRHEDPCHDAESAWMGVNQDVLDQLYYLRGPGRGALIMRMDAFDKLPPETRQKAMVSALEHVRDFGTPDWPNALLKAGHNLYEG